MPTGTVRFYNPKEGDGFISRPEPGRDVFVHIRDSDASILKEGVTVSFELAFGDRGPRALAVERVDST
ncbi:cold-shock protein [Natrialbaceae archaeon GCM10025810]|uniref:cold-shock protein n=1 Tax=Halovalidus salilacus TaxID=3075124 RepID=UPI0036191515